MRQKQRTESDKYVVLIDHTMTIASLQDRLAEAGSSRAQGILGEINVLFEGCYV